MIYPCPYCDTELNLQPEHIGRTITCPACNRSFVADDLPPVTIHKRGQEASSFTNVFKIVLYVIISVGLLYLLIFLFKEVVPNFIHTQQMKSELRAKGVDI